MILVGERFFSISYFASANLRELLPRPYFHIPLEQITGDDEMLDLVGSLVDTRYTQVAIPAFDRHFTSVAHTAVNLHHTINDTIGHVRAVQLRHACFMAVIESLIDLPGGM